MAMAHIHPTAVVSSQAELADDVEVGAYAYIGPAVHLGSGCVVHHHGVVESNVLCGKNNEIFPFAIIGGKTHDLKFDGIGGNVKIGDGNVFREYVTVHCGTKNGTETRIGNGNYLLAYAHVAHECILANDIIVSSKAVLGGHVELDSHCNIGGASAVHQFCKIGTHALLGGLSALVKDLPPYMIAEGNRARVRAYNRVGLERHGFDEKQIAAVRRMFRYLHATELNRFQALEKIRDDDGIDANIKGELFTFHSRCTRGML
ncbi:MAG: acyl-ACP--UDP-N-acetylglucosamine O-acyltransferase [Puniceicoccales bacterium]|jgi:UDP-N-acetylglucosamine acyltransferase|nr:acyl-ACP--UDP-N-acetylglucosamine O-acyltransferase [Puniceicoccales bacterium]